MLDSILNLHLWDQVYLGNSLGEYGEAALVFLGLLALLKIAQLLILSRLKKLAKGTETDLDDTFIEIVKSIKPPFYSFVALYFALKSLYITPWVSKAVTVILVVWVFYQVGRVVDIFIDYAKDKLVTHTDSGAEGSTRMAIQILGTLAKVVIWIIAILLTLSNLGVNVTSLLAGLGVGGVAVALAAQNILGDLFNSFVIYFDQPFVVGDIIQVGDQTGEVKKIGIKTTRIESLQGEELVFSNSQLTSEKIQNYGRMERWRGKIKFGVHYDTPQEKLEKVPEIVESAVEEIEDVKLSRAVFEEFGGSGINFEVVHYVGSADYNVFVKKNQQLAFQIREKLNEEGIDIPYPTRTVNLNKE